MNIFPNFLNMVVDTPLINILTYKLPYELSNQIYNEYQGRLREAKYLIENYKTYGVLKEEIKTVEILLSLSIFHKRIIANLDAAVKFYGTVSRISQADTVIRIGGYNLTGNEKNRLLAIVLNYKQLIEKFSITSDFMEYYETKELLKKIIALRSNFKHANSQENKNKRQQRESNEEDVPF
jgi:hypothetical protein